jgi:hypothetical protein
VQNQKEGKKQAEPKRKKEKLIEILQPLFSVVGHVLLLCDGQSSQLSSLVKIYFALHICTVRSVYVVECPAISCQPDAPPAHNYDNLHV